ncbi:hypothetical protein JVT61DRAFT_10821 [Boletus reticuloceps]|uniref:Uncharacterized protein n=1 Tax=Boletus reticuloceps TaxID=495285 RepID=A0A8I2YFL2_9AGAM|nr:hypothetical protein JVT61DRAFT_10821 [Boletus reticuloceps]
MAAVVPKGHLNDDADEAASAGLQLKKASGGGLGLRELITATQAQRLRSKQLASTAAKVFGHTQPQPVPVCELPVERDTDVSPNRKDNTIAKIKQWTSRVQKEQWTTSKSLVGAPSLSTATDVPPSTVASGYTQSTNATSLEDEDCEMDLDECDTYHGSFGEDGDGDDDLEREEALRATTKEKHSLVVLTQVPPRLIEWQFTLKRKNCETDDAPGITATTTSEDNLSGQETELDETLELEEVEISNETQPAGRRLTAALHFTNRVCL